MDTITSRSDRPILRLSAKEAMVITVIKPRPPSWIMARITPWPNQDHCVQVSTRIRPVTQVAEVAVNSPVKNPALSPPREAMGRVSSSAPARIIIPKEAATIRVAFRLRRRMSRPRSHRVKILTNALVLQMRFIRLFYTERHTGGNSFPRHAISYLVQGTGAGTCPIKAE